MLAMGYLFLFIPLAVFIFYPFLFFILILCTCTRFSLFTVLAWVGLYRVVGTVPRGRLVRVWV